MHVLCDYKYFNIWIIGNNKFVEYVFFKHFLLYYVQSSWELSRALIFCLIYLGELRD